MLLLVLLQEAQEMQLLKFKSELSPPAVPSTELAQLIKTSLHYPESYTHRFAQDRWDTLLPGGDTPLLSLFQGQGLGLGVRGLTR